MDLYIKVHTQNDRDRAFNILKVLYQKQNVFNFLRSAVKFLNTRKNVEFIQMSHENFFDLGSFLDDLYYDRPDPKKCQHPSCLPGKKVFGTHWLYCQEFHYEGRFRTEFIRRTMPTSMHKLKIIIRKKVKHLKQLEKAKKIGWERGSRLKKFRHFVVLEHQDYQMYPRPVIR